MGIENCKNRLFVGGIFDLPTKPQPQHKVQGIVERTKKAVKLKPPASKL